MGLIGREIIQSRIWPSEMVEKTGNYKEVFPITVFDAIYTEIGSEVTLGTIIDQMQRIITTHQTKLPGKGADQLVTYGGRDGEVGAIGITTKIQLEGPSNDRIPTEKAVANYLIDLGFVDDGGNISTAQRIRWANIIGRPLVYSTTGQNQDGYMTQKSITDQLDLINGRINSIDFSNDISELGNIISDHIENQYNPHHVTLAQLDGVSTDAFNAHVENTNNPHHVTKEQLGIPNVDNTSDLNKPISNAAQAKFDSIDVSIEALLTETEQFDTINTNLQTLNNHLNNYDNPHQVTIQQLNGVPVSDFNNHLSDYDNPHQVTKTQLGLSNVDNTSDLDKPISTATQTKFDLIDVDIAEIQRKQSLQIQTEQIADEAVTEYKLADESVSNTKIKPATPNTILVSNGETVSWEKVSNRIIENNSINGAKIINKSITVDQIADANIDSSKLVSDLILYGTPIKFDELDLNDYSNALVTSKWVNEQVFTSDHIADRNITGDKLFTTERPNTVLSVIEPNSSPVYSKITHNMLNDFIIEANNIKNLNVTELKLANDSVSNIKIKDNAITNEKIADESITTSKIYNGSITSEKIFKANQSGMVLMSDSTKYPVYKRLTNDDVDLNDQSIPVSKLESIDQKDRVLAVITNNTNPIWTKINSDMLRDKIIDGSKLFTSPISNRVLAVENMYEDAFYTQVNTEMIKDGAVTGDKIAEYTILYDHLSPSLKESDWITTANIQDKSITGSKMFRSELPDRVLGVVGDPYDEPQWLQINRNMIENEAVNGDKLWCSGIVENPYRVIGVTGPDVPPEYLMITGDFIVETSIPGSKLVPNIILSGTPKIEIDPDPLASDHTIASTGWVQSKITTFQNQIDTIINDLSGTLVESIPEITENDLDDIFNEIWPISSNNSGNE